MWSRSAFETFSNAIRASWSPSTLRDLLAQPETHKLFLKSLHGTASPPVAFSAATGPLLLLFVVVVVDLIGVVAVVVAFLRIVNCVEWMDTMLVHILVFLHMLIIDRVRIRIGKGFSCRVPCYFEFSELVC